MTLWSCEICRVLMQKPKIFRTHSRIEIEAIFRKVDMDPSSETLMDLLTHKIVHIGYGPDSEKRIRPLFLTMESDEHAQRLLKDAKEKQLVGFCYVCQSGRILDPVEM